MPVEANAVLSDADADSIDGFCQRHRISRRTFYQLQAEGRGPRIMKVGTRTLISREAAAEWRRRIEAQSPQTSG